MSREVTAIHEAGHAVAFSRLFGDTNRHPVCVTIVHDDDSLGSHLAEPLEFLPDEDEAVVRKACINDAIYACAGYAAVLAADYSESEALAGCESDFEKATASGVIELEDSKRRAVALMSANRAAVSRLAAELMKRLTIADWVEVEIIIEIADGLSTDEDLARYRIGTGASLSGAEPAA